MNMMVWCLSDGQGFDLSSNSVFRFKNRCRSHHEVRRSLSLNSPRTDSKKVLPRQGMVLNCLTNDESQPEEPLDFRTEMINFATEAQSMVGIETLYDMVTPVTREAMQYCIKAYLGTISPSIFDIRYTSLTEHFKTLILSVIITGYMLKNIEVRKDLDMNFDDSSQLDPDVQISKVLMSEVAGHVTKVSNDGSAPTIMHTKAYIEELLAKINRLEKQQEMRFDSEENNPVIQYARNCTKENEELLFNNASEEALIAMKICSDQFISDKSEDEESVETCEMRQPELRRLMYWLMVFGYNVRCREIRHEMENVLRMDKPPELPSS